MKFLSNIGFPVSLLLAGCGTQALQNSSSAASSMPGSSGRVLVSLSSYYKNGCVVSNESDKSIVIQNITLFYSCRGVMTSKSKEPNKTVYKNTQYTTTLTTGVCGDMQPSRCTISYR